MTTPRQWMGIRDLLETFNEDRENEAASTGVNDQWGYDRRTTTRLTYGYQGGVASSAAGALTRVASGSVLLTPSATNYVERTYLGVVSANTIGFTVDGIAMAVVVTGATGIASVADYRNAQAQSAAALAAEATARGAAIAAIAVSGAGSPEGVVTASVGKLYEQTDAVGGAVLWVKVLGAGNTGWLALGIGSGEQDPRAYGAKYAGEDPSSFVTSALTAAGVLSRVRGSVRNDPEKPSAFQSLLAALDEAQESVALQVLSDSTGNETSEWVYLVTQYLAAQYPAFTVNHQLFNDATQAYDAPTVIQTGPNGARYLQVGAATNIIPSAEVPMFATDVDIRVCVAPTAWVSGAFQTLVAKFASPSARVFRFQIDTTGRLFWSYCVDGSTLLSATSTANPSGTVNGQPLWVRVVHIMNNGSAGTTIQFYQSADGTNGTAWTQIGANVINAGALTTLYQSSTADWELGGRGGTAELLAGKIYGVDLKDGIGGTSLAPQTVDAWQSLLSASGANGSTAGTFGGSPVLTVVNGSVPGKGVSYLSDPTHFAKLTPKWGQAAILLASSHNEYNLYGPSLLTMWDTWLTAIKARFPLAAIALCTENPRTSPAPYIREHAIRRRQLMAWAQRNNLGVIDTYRAFRQDGRAMSALVDPADGIHPLIGTGRVVYAQSVMTALTRRGG